MNTRKLKSKMVLYGDSQSDLAKALGISLSRLNAKINGNNADFRQNEILFICERYDLSSEEVNEIFFESKVSNQDTK